MLKYIGIIITNDYSRMLFCLPSKIAQLNKSNLSMLQIDKDMTLLKAFQFYK